MQKDFKNPAANPWIQPHEDGGDERHGTVTVVARAIKTTGQGRAGGDSGNLSSTDAVANGRERSVTMTG